MDRIVAAGTGVLVAVAGMVGLAVTLAVHIVWQGIRYERLAVFERELAVERREAALEERVRAVSEWEGRLMQVVECGCCVACRSRPEQVGSDVAGSAP